MTALYFIIYPWFYVAAILFFGVSVQNS